jgi:hypothetical protein
MGVLAYDKVADRIQCAACGRWYRKLTAGHLQLHELTVAEYKEHFGLNRGTALETPTVTEIRRRQVLLSSMGDNACRLPEGGCGGIPALQIA